MAKKQVYGLKSSRGLCPVCNEQIQYIKFIKPTTEGTKTFKFNESVERICKCPDKTLQKVMN